MIERDISQQIKNDFNRGKIIVVLGARQVGKTTLLDNLIKDEKDVLMFNSPEMINKMLDEYELM